MTSNDADRAVRVLAARSQRRTSKRIPPAGPPRTRFWSRAPWVPSTSLFLDQEMTRHGTLRSAARCRRRRARWFIARGSWQPRAAHQPRKACACRAYARRVCLVLQGRLPSDRRRQGPARGRIPAATFSTSRPSCSAWTIGVSEAPSGKRPKRLLAWAPAALARKHDAAREAGETARQDAAQRGARRLSQQELRFLEPDECTAGLGFGGDRYSKDRIEALRKLGLW
jgi:hypothetical protein